MLVLRAKGNGETMEVGLWGENGKGNERKDCNGKEG
jgi:hypothetical protein